MRVAVIMLAATCALAFFAPRAQAQVQVEGYRVDLHWEPGGGDPRALMNGPGGRLWVGCGDGSLRILEPPGKEGAATGAKLFTRGLWNPNGLAWRPARNGKGYEVFVCHTTARFGGNGRITRFIDRDADGVLDDVSFVVLNLPPGAHQTNNLAFGKDGLLYFSQGATADRGPGGGALIGRVDPDAKNLRWGDKAIEIHATGLRNAWGIAFHSSGALLATDNVSDKLEDKTPPDELNVIRAGGDYGFPAVEGAPPEGHASIGPIADLGVHGAASGLCVDADARFGGFHGQVFVAKWGSWTGSPGIDAGSGLVRVQLHRTKSGEWKTAVHDLLPNCGRPLDVVVGADGGLYFSVQTSCARWSEAVYRMAPVDDVTLRLDGAPVAGGRFSAVVHASGRASKSVRIRGQLGGKPIDVSSTIGADGRSAAIAIDVPPSNKGEKPATADGYLRAEILDEPKGKVTARSPKVPVSIL